MMEELTQEPEVQFNPEKVKLVIQQGVKQVLDKVVFNAQKVDQWTSTVIETILKGLRALDKPYKYIVSCIIMQKTGAGLHSSFVAHWDTNFDGYCTEYFENDTIQCVTTVYGIAI